MCVHTHTRTHNVLLFDFTTHSRWTNHPQVDELAKTIGLKFRQDRVDRVGPASQDDTGRKAPIYNWLVSIVVPPSDVCWVIIPMNYRYNPHSSTLDIKEL